MTAKISHLYIPYCTKFHICLEQFFTLCNIVMKTNRITLRKNSILGSLSLTNYHFKKEKKF